MRIEPDFIRKLLLKIDSWESFNPVTNKDLADNDTPINKVNIYLDFLMEEELINAKKTEYIGGTKLYQIRYLTLKGQKFVDIIKPPTIWEKHKETIISAGISSLSEIISMIINHLN